MCLAIPGRITCITSEEDLGRTGKVDFGGILKEVNLSCVPETQVGDYVIVHVGVAISKVDEEEARQVFQYLEQIDALGELNNE